MKKPTPETVAAGAAGAAVGAPGLGLAAGAAQQGGKGMAWGRGGGQAAITSGSSSGGGGHRGSQAQGIFAGAADAVESAGQQLSDPPNANTAIDALESAGEFLEMVGQVFDNMGKSIIDSVYFDPRVTEYFEQLGQYVKAAADPTKEGAANVRQVHAEELEKIEANDPKVRKWDLQAHDD